MAPADTKAAVTLADVEQAARTIAGAVAVTDCDPSRTLGEILGCRVWLKFENLQFTASFKERGALNRLAALDTADAPRGVIAMSAGNHAQGVAYHASRLGIPATIVMPIGTPMVKVENTRRHGAEVIVTGDTLEDAAAFAHEHGKDKGLTFIHPYDDPLVIAGQGTVALEMLAAVPDLDTLVVPIGGGGLISGMAVAAKALKPGIQVIGVQALLYPSMFNAIKGQTLPMRGDTLAEGIAVKAPGRITTELVRRTVDDILLVTEADIECAVSLLITIEKTVVEGAGAAGLAAVHAQQGTVYRPQRWAGAVRRQHRYASACGCPDARACSRRTPVTACHRSRGPARSACARSAIAGRCRGQYRGGLASARILRPAGQGHAAGGGDRDARPCASR